MVRFFRRPELLRRYGSGKAITAAVARGELHRVAWGMYVREPPTDLVRLEAMRIRQRNLTYTGETAAFIYDLGPMTWPATGRTWRRGSHHGGPQLELSTGRVRRHRKIHGLYVTTPVETAVDLAELGYDRAVLEDFLTRSYAGAKGNDILAEDLAAMPPRRRAAASRLLDGVITGTASKLELRAVRAILAALGGTEVTVLVNAKVGGYRFDVVIPEARVLVEIDSYAYHAADGERRDSRTFAGDRWKANAATRRGWTVLRYADVCVDAVPEMVGEQVADTVRYNLAHRPRWRRDGLLRTDHPFWWWHPLFPAFR
jgi:very-short-patch-repair endonuclease